MTSRAKLARDGNGDAYYELSGSKTWITNAPVADVLLVWAKDDEAVVRGFILEKVGTLAWWQPRKLVGSGAFGQRASQGTGAARDALACRAQRRDRLSSSAWRMCRLARQGHEIRASREGSCQAHGSAPRRL